MEKMTFKYLDTSSLSHIGHSGVENVVSHLEAASSKHGFVNVVWDGTINSYRLAASNEVVSFENSAILLIPDIPRISARIEFLLKCASNNPNLKMSLLVHDLLPLTNPEFFPEHAVNEFADFLSLFAYSHTVGSVSQETLLEVELFLQSKGLEKVLRCWRLPYPLADKKSIQATQSKLTSSDQLRVLVLGNIEPRKNLEFIFKNLNALTSEFRRLRLDFVGAHQWGTPNFEDQVQSGREQGVDIRIHKNLSQFKLDILWLETHLLIYPSFKEGFGLPIVEAVYRGIPVLANQSLPSSKLIQNHPLFVGFDLMKVNDFQNKLARAFQLCHPTDPMQVVEGAIKQKQDWVSWAQQVLDELKA